VGVSTAPDLVTDVVDIEEALVRIAYLLTRVRRHELIRTSARVPLDRAAAVVLRHLAENDTVRPGEVATSLGVEAPHVTRQVQQLQRLGYVTCGPDDNDRRAQLIRLTPAGRDAADRIREVSRGALEAALAAWSPRDLHQLARLFPRMVDDYLAYAARRESEQGAG
jgi:DNA-binding MarR family transcriptional regulator